MVYAYRYLEPDRGDEGAERRRSQAILAMVFDFKQQFTVCCSEWKENNQLLTNFHLSPIRSLVVDNEEIHLQLM